MCEREGERGRGEGGGGGGGGGGELVPCSHGSVTSQQFDRNWFCGSLSPHVPYI